MAQIYKDENVRRLSDLYKKNPNTTWCNFLPIYSLGISTRSNYRFSTFTNKC